MKIRNGFVSNSSSSSFVIMAENKFSTVRDVARYIISRCEEEWKNDGENEPRFVSELQAILNTSEPNTPVYFDTFGEETYIRKYEDKIIVKTTQNVIFDAIDAVALESSDLSDEFFDFFDYIDEEGEMEGNRNPFELLSYQEKFNDFLILKLNILGRKIYIDNCPHCKRGISHGYILKNGKEYCECQINQVIRKEKLKKIDENFRDK